MAIPVDRHGNSTFSPIFIALLLDSVGLLTQPAHDSWLLDNRSSGWWATSIATLQASPADVSLGALYAQALESNYCAQHFQNLRLSPEAAALFEMWHDHAQLVVAGSAGTVADPDIISVRDAFSILLSHPEIFDGYLPGELQEAFLTILGRDSAQQIALHAQSFLHRNPHSAQRAAQPLLLMPVGSAARSGQYPTRQGSTPPSVSRRPPPASQGGDPAGCRGHA